MLRDVLYIIQNQNSKVLLIHVYCVSELQNTQKATLRTQTNRTERWITKKNTTNLFNIINYPIGHFVEYFDSGTNYSLAPA